jgi:uncharacterized protein involved in exopolysaccharide biosynthesis
MVSDEIEGGEGNGLTEFVRDPVGMLQRRWPWMLPALCLGLAASGIVSWSVEPGYYAEATVLLASQQLSEELVEPTVHDDALSRVDAIVGEVLASPNLTELIERHRLYPELAAETLDNAIARVRSNTTIELGKSVTRTRRGETAQVYLIGFEADRPELAAGVANDLANTFVAASVSARLRLHSLATDFLRRELESASNELREQSRKIAEFKQAHRGVLPSDLDANLIKLERIQQERQSLAQQIAEAEGRVVMLSSAADGEASPDTRLEALRAELRRLQTTHTEKHPDVRALQHEIASLERQIGPEAASSRPAPVLSRASLRETTHQTVERLRSQLEETERQLADFDERVQQTPIYAEQLAALQERELILREGYFEFLRKLRDAQLAEDLQQAQQGAHASILSPARPPSHPVRAPWKYAAVGVAASVALALGLGMLLEAIDPVLVTAHQVERAGGFPVIGSVGRIR